MKICLIENMSEAGLGFVEALKAKGHIVTKECNGDYDIILNGSIFNMDKAIEMQMRFPRIPMVNYCWDLYKWAYEDTKSYLNWSKYAAFLRKSQAVLVPSKAQQLRLKEMLEIDSVVVETSINTYEHEVSDERFVLDPVRHYPEENKGWVEKACEELGIKCIHSEHQFSLEDFRKLVHSCTFMTCAYREASTGGLSLMEGLWNGKPSLVSNSPYMGANDYIGPFGRYFQYDDYNDLKDKIWRMFNHPPKIDVADARKYIQANFSHEVMADKIIKVCEQLKK